MIRSKLRVRELGEFEADALLALAFAIAGVAESAVDASGGHSRPLTGLAAVALSVTLAWRRRNTVAATLGFTAVAAAVVPLNTFLFGSLNSPFVAVMVLAYSVGRHESGRRMWLELALLAVAMELASLVGGSAGVLDTLWTAMFLGGPALAGRGIRSRVLLQREMREKTARLAAERELRAQRAVDEERARIASELQALIANGVSAMVVQSEAVPRLLERGERAAAEEALEVIEETGRDALAEMRRLLGVLRRDASGPVLAPQPTLAAAEALLARVQAQGLQTALEIAGSPAPLPPGIDLAGYRVLQEALASAGRAPGVSRADVSISYGDDLSIRVCDDGEPGEGPDPEVLRALRERVGLYGGMLRAVPRQGTRGFEIEARLPLGGGR